MSLDWPGNALELCSPGSVDTQSNTGHSAEAGATIKAAFVTSGAENSMKITSGLFLRLRSTVLQKLFAWPTDLLGLLPARSPAYAVT
jgi:hypothetical protein